MTQYDRLLAGSPLRQPGLCVAIGGALLAVLGIATAIQVDVIRGMRSDVAGVFLRALLLSSLLATVPLVVL